jgi:hypothetical protein
MKTMKLLLTLLAAGLKGGELHPHDSCFLMAEVDKFKGASV